MKRTTEALHTAAERLVEWWVGFHNLQKAGSNFKMGFFCNSLFKTKLAKNSSEGFIPPDI